MGTSKMAYKGSSYINILTYIVFTIVPIIMFATILESKRVSVLVESQKTCRKTLEKVSKTLKSFSEAFKIQWERTNKAEGKLQKTLGHFSVLQKDLVYKDNITLKLQD